MNASIDINVDVGEVPSEVGRQLDESLMRLASTANVACGVHAGDPEIMRRTVLTAERLAVAVHAHPGFADRASLGRADLVMEPREIETLVREQLAALAQICREENIRLRGVKPHGALYHQAASSPDIAAAVCRAVLAINPSLGVVGLAGSGFLDVACGLGLRAIREAFADRNYTSEGFLVPRGDLNAFIQDPELAADRVLQLIRRHIVVAEGGRVIGVEAESICIHSDSLNVVAIATRIREVLAAEGISIRPAIR